MYPEYKSESGTFQELIHKDDVVFGQISYLVIYPGHTRGGHYHKRKAEWFMLLKGECVLIVKGVNVDIMNRQVDMERKELYPCHPFEKHWVHNTGTEPVEMLVVSSEVYNPNDPDTIKEDEG